MSISLCSQIRGLRAAVIQLKFTVFGMVYNTRGFKSWALAVQLQLNTLDRL